MKIKGDDLLPFMEAQAATVELDPKTLNGIPPMRWEGMRENDEMEASVSPFPVDIVPDLVICNRFVPLRALKSSAIRRLGLHHRPSGVAA